MVVLSSFAVINDNIAGESGKQGETLEAQEGKVIDSYEKALRSVRAGDYPAAEVAFRTVLQQQIVHDGATEQLQRINFLSLKNLAGILALRSECILEAVQLYIEAAEIDGSDTIVWDRLGTLASEQGIWVLARQAFQRGLQLDPTHPTLADKLLQLLLHVGDGSGALALSKALLQCRERHSVAANIVKKGPWDTDFSDAIKLLQLPPIERRDGEPMTDDSPPVAHIQMELPSPSFESMLKQYSVIFSALLQLNARSAEHSNDVHYVSLSVKQPEAQQQPGGGASAAMTLPTAFPLLPNNNAANGQPAAIPQVPAAAVPQAPQSAANAEAPKPAEKDAQQDTGQGGSTADKKTAKEQPKAPLRSSRRRKKKEAVINLLQPQQQPGAEAAPSETDVDPFYLLQSLAPLLAKTRTEAASLGNNNSDNIDQATTTTTSLNGNNNNRNNNSASGAAEADAVNAFINNLPQNGFEVFTLGWDIIKAVLSFAAAQENVSSSKNWLTSAIGEKVANLVWLLHRDIPQYGQDIGPEISLMLAELLCDAAGKTSSSSAAAGGSASTAAGLDSSSQQEGANAVPSNEANLGDFLRCGMLWLSRYRAALLASDADDDGAQQLASELRYWWARGRIEELDFAGEEASQSYKNCLDLLKAPDCPQQVTIPYCSMDSCITAATVKGKLEVLQLHEVMVKAGELLKDGLNSETGGKCKDLLIPVLLTCDEKEELMARVDYAKWAHGLKLLLDCADATGDEVLSLRCRLRQLHGAMPQEVAAWKSFLDAPSDDATIPEPPFTAASVAIELLTRPEASAVLNATATFLQEASAALQKKIVAESSSALHPVEWTLVYNTSFRLVSFLQLCVLSPILGRSARDGNRIFALSTRGNAAKLAMSDASLAFINMLELGALGGVGSSTTTSAPPLTPDATLTVTRVLCEALGDAGALAARSGRVIDACMHRIHAAIPLAEHNEEEANTSRQKPKQQAETHDQEEEEESTLDSLRAGLHHCIYWLHGVRLPGIDDEVWGGAAGPDEPTSTVAGMVVPLRKLESKQAAATIWSLVSDHLAKQSHFSLTRNYKELINDIGQFFQPHPALWHACWQAWKDLESKAPPDVGQSTPHNPMSGLLETAVAAEKEQCRLQQEEEAALMDIDGRELSNANKPPRKGSLEEDLATYGSVYKSFYYLQAVTQPSLEDQLKSKGGMTLLDPPSDAIFEDLLLPYKLDLCFNHDRFLDGWRYMGTSYDAAAEMLLMQAADELNRSQWRQRVDLQQRAERYKRLGLWSEAISARYVQEPDDLTDIMEDAGERLFLGLQNVLPKYDQLRLQPDTEDAAYKEQCSAALRAFQRALERLPDEWVFHWRIGQCHKLLGEPASDYLPHFSKACRCATVHAKGLLDAVHALHSERLETLLETKAAVESNPGWTAREPALDTLNAVTMCCFSAKTQAAAEKIIKSKPAKKSQWKGHLAKAWAVLVEDCAAAMQWCLDKDQHFSPASYSLALAKLHISEKDNGGLQNALNELAPLFTKFKQPFCFNVVPVTTRNGDGGGGGARGRRKRKVDNITRPGSLPSPPAGSGVAAMELHSSQQQQASQSTITANLSEDDGTFGYPPESTGRTVGIGLSETARQFTARLRRSIELYLRLALYTGSVDVLTAAVQYFKTNKEWKPAAFGDIVTLSKGCMVMAVLSSAQSVCPLEDIFSETDSQPGSQQQQEGDDGSNNKMHTERFIQVADTLAKSLNTEESEEAGAAADIALQAGYQLWIDNTLLKEAGASSGGPGGDATTTNAPGGLQSPGGSSALPLSINGSTTWQQSVVAPARAALAFTKTYAFKYLPGPGLPLPEDIASLETLLPHSKSVLTAYSELCVYVFERRTGGYEKLRNLVTAFKRRYKSLRLVKKDVQVHGNMLMAASMNALARDVDEMIEQCIERRPQLAEPAPVAPQGPPGASTMITPGKTASAAFGGGQHNFQGMQGPARTTTLTEAVPMSPPVLQHQLSRALANSDVANQQAMAMLKQLEQYEVSGLPPPLMIQQQAEFAHRAQELALAAQKQAEEAILAHYAVMKEQMEQRASMSAEDIELQDKVVELIKVVLPFYRSISWVQGSMGYQEYAQMVQRTESLMLSMLRMYRLLAGQPDIAFSVADCIRACDDAIKAQKKLVKPAAAAPPQAQQQQQQQGDMYARVYMHSNRKRERAARLLEEQEKEGQEDDDEEEELDKTEQQDGNNDDDEGGQEPEVTGAAKKKKESNGRRRPAKKAKTVDDDLVVDLTGDD